MNNSNITLNEDLELGHILSYAVKTNYISETRANQIRKQILENQRIRELIDNGYFKRSLVWILSSLKDRDPERDGHSLDKTIEIIEKLLSILKENQA